MADAVAPIMIYDKAVSALTGADVTLSGPVVPRQRRDARLTWDGTGVTTTLYSLPETPADMRCSFTGIFYYLK